MKRLFIFLLILFNANLAFGYYTENVVDGCDNQILDFDNDNLSAMYASFTPFSYTCDTGYFLPADTLGCVACPTGYDCGGGTFNFNERIASGINTKSAITQNVNNICSQNLVRSDNNDVSHIYADFTINTYTCNPGYYLPAGQDWLTDNDGCTICPADSYCGGGTYTFNETTAQGATKCPTWYTYNTDTGKTSATQCQIHCDAGTYASGYAQLEYIESTGTQYIDTGIKPANTPIGIETEFALTNSTQHDRWMFGYLRWQGGSINGFELGIYNNLIRGEIYNNRNTVMLKDFATADTNWHTVKMNSPYGGTQYDNQIIYDYHSDWIPGYEDVNMYLFARKALGQTGDYPISVKIKYFKLYMGGILVRDFVPARRNSDGVLGIYDKVSGTFFTNSGTGTFVAGPDISLCALCPENSYCPGETLNYGATTSNGIIACSAGLFAPRGMWEPEQCGRILHVGDGFVYLRSTKKTEHALHVDLNHDGVADYFGNMTTLDVPMSRETPRKLKVRMNGIVYSIYDDSVDLSLYE